MLLPTIANSTGVTNMVRDIRRVVWTLVCQLASINWLWRLVRMLISNKLTAQIHDYTLCPHDQALSGHSARFAPFNEVVHEDLREVQKQIKRKQNVIFLRGLDESVADMDLNMICMGLVELAFYFT